MNPNTPDPANDSQNSAEPNKVNEPVAPTKIIINNEDGSIINESDVPETSQKASSEEVISSPTASDQEPSPLPQTAPEINESNNDQEGPSPTTPAIASDPVSDEDTTKVESPPSVEPTGTPTAEPVQESHSAQPQEPNPMAIPAQAPVKAGAPKAAIIVAIVIALLLAAVSVFAYMKMKKTEDHSVHENKQSTQNTEPEKKPVTSDEVDTTMDEIDTELNKTTEDKDLPSSDGVSDAGLGL